MDNENSVVTLGRLQTFLNKLKTLFVKKNTQAALTGVEVNSTAVITSEVSGTNAVLKVSPVRLPGISVKLISENGEVVRTVATCEDTSQDIKANTLQSACLIGRNPSNSVTSIVGFPDVELPQGITPSTTGYLGEMLTTRFRHMELRRTFMGNDDEQVTIELYPGAYNFAEGHAFNFVIRRDTQLITSQYVSEYWVDLVIPESADPDEIDIQFNIRELVWATQEPDWSSYSGYRFQIHIIGNIADIVLRYKLNQSDPTPYQPESVFDGTIGEALDYARDGNLDKRFQWILRLTDGDVDIVKPVWHIGDGVFIDAFGHAITDGTEPGLNS